jgi:ribose-phosphate pyrophosphokinase
MSRTQQQGRTPAAGLGPRPSGPCLLAPAATRALAERVASILDTPLTPVEEREFEFGEHKIRPLECVRDRDVYVLHSLRGDASGSANDRLCRLMLLTGALRDAGAGRVTLCLPYLAYARKDRRTKARDPLALRYVAQALEAVGADRVVTLDVHNLAAFENAFRCPTVHLEAAPLIVEHVAGRDRAGPMSVVSPDVGGIKRAEHLRELLEQRLGEPVAAAFMNKKRSDDLVSGDTLVGDVEGRHVLVVDDLISSGTTVRRALDACRRAGAARVDVAATHAAFTSEAARLLEAGGPDRLIVTDSVDVPAPFAESPATTVLGVAGLFAEAIRRLHAGEPVSDLGGL